MPTSSSTFISVIAAQPARSETSRKFKPARAFPTLYQINTRVLLSSLSHDLGRTATLDDIPTALLDQITDRGFNWVWFLGAWQTGPAGREISLANPEWVHKYQKLLPDFCNRDVCGSRSAICSYFVHSDFEEAALARLRERLRGRGLRLLLDFVSNQVRGRIVRLRDLMSSAAYDRDGDEIGSRGLYMELPPGGYHVFEVTTQSKTQSIH